MAVNPIGNVTYINQNAQVGSTQYANAQVKGDFQAMVNLQIMEEKQNEIEEVRPTEETLKSDEDAKGQAREEDEEKKQAKKEYEEKEEDSIEVGEDGIIKHLDISI
ncbi:hypothetical protein [Helicobacter mesocricetorum]|uniref:hypothetical protein n=1 Tax=Helicobacter mesocricetorum TaxID=87012 RepID=UPI000CF169C5|nr:hypothetical protein [Helicobacter mesocricetorum]